MNNFLLEQQQKNQKEWKAILTEFIQKQSEARELKQRNSSKWRYRVNHTLRLPKFWVCINLYYNLETRIWSQRFRRNQVGVVKAHQLFDSEQRAETITMLQTKSHGT